MFYHRILVFPDVISALCSLTTTTTTTTFPHSPPRRDASAGPGGGSTEGASSSEWSGVQAGRVRTSVEAGGKCEWQQERGNGARRHRLCLDGKRRYFVCGLKGIKVDSFLIKIVVLLMIVDQ
ncbi:hypothetical protein C8F04DRAFT_1188067 [Mycena alexandri]|uniref:Uncharacterized protein n=1 Tax=Mycena alexandri TaxID=1745969 RepID=A0AAD6SNJ6_9AGAR|nr:hypothetical protein C8F04DRAFT_1191798 [Mycena alexandri]KAJ7028962.1 hypothetical protein C8F04DRAFT_1188067 [Mycena alexandri]